MTKPAQSGQPLLLAAEAPLLISCPHDGSAIPDWLAARLEPWACASPDTDWHVARLYRPATAFGAGLLRAHWSRYLIDLNRPADAQPLYPGRHETGLCPRVAFDGRPLYRLGMEPGPDEQAERVRDYWWPYHRCLREQLDRLRARYARVVLWEGHSIRSRVPMFFDGQLPDLNLGTDDGRSCAPELQRSLEDLLRAQRDFSWVSNGRFKGGYITRHYGRPAEGISAVQLEISQCAYMDEDTGAWDQARAARLAPLLMRLLRVALDWAEGRY